MEDKFIHHFTLIKLTTMAAVSTLNV